MKIIALTSLVLTSLFANQAFAQQYSQNSIANGMYAQPNSVQRKTLQQRVNEGFSKLVPGKWKSDQGSAGHPQSRSHRQNLADQGLLGIQRSQPTQTNWQNQPQQHNPAPRVSDQSQPRTLNQSPQTANGIRATQHNFQSPNNRSPVRQANYYQAEQVETYHPQVDYQTNSLRMQGSPIEQGTIQNEQQPVDHVPFQEIHQRVPNSVSSGQISNSERSQIQPINNRQFTASERVIQLEDYIQTLHKQINDLQQQNNAAEAKIQEKTQLLSAAETAMRTASDKLSFASKTNLDLASQVEALKLEREKLQLQTERLLDQIKTDLDDILASELANGK